MLISFWITSLLLSTFFTITLGQSESANTTETETPVIQKYIGCVIYRTHSMYSHSTVEYLLLQSGHGRYRWVLPKGVVKYELKVSERDYAVVKLHEKLGLGEKDLRILPDFEIHSNFTVCNVSKIGTFYLAEMMNSDLDLKKKLPWYYKEYKWLPLEDALLMVVYEDLRSLLQESHDHLRKIKVII